MRRADREIQNIKDIIQVMEKCDVCRLALNDNDYPYILPLNFGMQTENEQIILYFHGANKGKKYELIAKDNRASFEMDCSHNFVTRMSNESCSCTMEYESVIGHGRIEIVPDNEKHQAFHLLMKHYHQKDGSFNPSIMSCTTVLKLIVEQISGKTHIKKQKNKNL